MLKGVNKLIVEVSNPDSEFFERAIFFVKPQMKNTPTSELNRNANKLLNQAGTAKNRKWRSRVVAIFRFAGAVALGAAAATLIKFLA
ncbi:MAG: hypothetical protein FWD34_00040 [Oscillospiraceae bacterium]|nr:hypothetical protein [Oscillospiraceae bacterium]